MARFAVALWRPISTNTGGRMTANLGCLLHHQVGNNSLFGWFNNPGARVSAHFWISRMGLIEQYVDTDTVSWHAINLNPRYVGVETEGCLGRDEAMTNAQVDAFARLYEEGSRRHGWPNALINRNGDRGFGFHRMTGFSGSTACPCTIRLNQRREILNRAFSRPVIPPPEQPQEEILMIILRLRENNITTTYTYDGTTVNHLRSVPDNDNVTRALGGDRAIADVTREQLIIFNGGTFPRGDLHPAVP